MSTPSDSPSSSVQEPPIAVLLGLPFHDLTPDEALDECRHALNGKQPQYFVTANVDFAAQAYRNPALRVIFFYAHRIFCDGMPLVWLSRLLGHPLRARVTGADLVPALLKLCADEGKRVYFFGSDHKTLAEVVAILGERMPDLNICGYESPPMGQIDEWDNFGILHRMRKNRADLLLLALGCPKQELWIHRYHEQCGAKLSIGIGASLDFISGKQVRAPRWMQKTGLEWMWRMGT
ncbi:MAG: WecB/TagA/CpsF family glycosyltransferase, partial [Puniceicoccales bacterium]